MTTAPYINNTMIVTGKPAWSPMTYWLNQYTLISSPLAWCTYLEVNMCLRASLFPCRAITLWSHLHVLITGHLIVIFRTAYYLTRMPFIRRLTASLIQVTMSGGIWVWWARSLGEHSLKRFCSTQQSRLRSSHVGRGVRQWLHGTQLPSKTDMQTELVINETLYCTESFG